MVPGRYNYDIQDHTGKFLPGLGDWGILKRKNPLISQSRLVNRSEVLVGGVTAPQAPPVELRCWPGAPSRA